VQAAELVFSTMDRDSYPWIFETGGGVNTTLLEMVAANLGHTIKIKRVPWKRCLRPMERNEVDGCYAASFKKVRMASGIFPRIGDKINPSKRLHDNSYTLYTLKDAPLGWDGNNFVNLTGKIGGPAGFSIIAKLKEKGVGVFETDSAEKVLKMLAKGRFKGAAALTPQAARILRANPKLAAQIQKVKIPPVEKPYYLMFSHLRAKTTPGLVDDFYKEIERVRNSQVYKDAVATILKNRP
jgi:polar amino acid transport system substrate-binding protein